MSAASLFERNGKHKNELFSPWLGFRNGKRVRNVPTFTPLKSRNMGKNNFTKKNSKYQIKITQTSQKAAHFGEKNARRRKRKSQANAVPVFIKGHRYKMLQKSTALPDLLKVESFSVCTKLLEHLFCTMQMHLKQDGKKYKSMRQKKTILASRPEKINIRPKTQLQRRKNFPKNDTDD